MAVGRLITVVALIVAMVDADVYMHNPRGCNNRLNEPNRNRNNGNRLFDSQNNKRGGYNKGGPANTVADPMKFVAGSTLKIEWTNQHECGQENTKCDIILQYMCDPQLRDGTNTGTISTSLTRNQQNKGRHESPQYYQACRARENNNGLFHADQKLNRAEATRTRQNPGGTRRGLECPEERDYYPYWAPSPWIDIAILTDDPSKCTKAELDKSQNTAAVGYCAFTNGAALNRAVGSRKRDKKAPLDPAKCTGPNLEWKAGAPNGGGTPYCGPVPKSRDNQNGNTGAPPVPDSGGIPQTASYDWVIPADVQGDKCSIRIRYNITVGDYNTTATAAQDEGSDDCPKINIGDDVGLSSADAKERGYKFQNNPTIKPLMVNGRATDKLQFQLAINTAQTGRTFQDRTHRVSFVKRKTTGTGAIPANAKIHNLSVRGRRGNIVQVYPAVEYDYTPNVLEVAPGDYIHAQWTGALTYGNNDDGEGQKRTDKSNMIMLNIRDPKQGTQRSELFGFPGNSYPRRLDQQRLMNLPLNIAQQAAAPSYKGYKPARYYVTSTTTGDVPSDVTPNIDADMVTELEDEIEDAGVLLNDTIGILRYAKEHPRMRRGLTVITGEEPLEDDKEKEDTVKDDANEEDEFDDIVKDDANEEDEFNDTGKDVGKYEDELNGTGKDDEFNDIDDDETDLDGVMDPTPRRSRWRRRRRRRGQQQQSARSRSRSRRTRQQNNDPLLINNLLNNSPYHVDLGPIAVPPKSTTTPPGTSEKWHYMCSRNNNFSNRSQKGKIVIL